MTVAVEVVSGELFAVPPTTEVRDSSASLLLQSAANRYGTAVLTLKLRDTGGTANGGKDSADPVQLVVVVRDVNDPPLFEVPTTITVDNGSLVSTMTQDGFGEGVVTIKVTDGKPETPPSGTQTCGL
eukprot:TRINITY_DN6064_c0_g1_i1.p4 TRINITY_DN6064_c0_g1~~TRINITY_DN6064_c0_g1_i1.p4  ORF type:complete len:127 (+),score=36.70 TRINITY_DN6064_c0_g1_i1:778-1158(+)